MYPAKSVARVEPFRGPRRTWNERAPVACSEPLWFSRTTLSRGPSGACRSVSGPIGRDDRRQLALHGLEPPVARRRGRARRRPTRRATSRRSPRGSPSRRRRRRSESRLGIAELVRLRFAEAHLRERELRSIEGRHDLVDGHRRGLEIRRSEAALRRRSTSPVLVRLRRADQRVPRLLEVLRRVPERGVVAAADLAARKAHAQVHPRRADLLALLAAERGREAR